MVKSDGYKSLLLGLVLVGFIVLFSGTAMALPVGSDTITDPYDPANDSVTLQGLTNVTANNSPADPKTEHNHNVGDNGVGSLGSTTVSGFTFKTTNGPHGRFTNNTASCGRCHALHTAQSKRLIRFQTIATNATPNNAIYGTCTFCHNFNGQSTYDVKDGMIWDTSDGMRYATNGGGFERMLVVEGEPQVATVVKASSSHRVNHPEGTKFRVPGGSDANPGVHIELTCTSCHNPHSENNGFPRLLRKKIMAPNSSDGNLTLIPTTQFSGGAMLKLSIANPFTDEKSTYNAEIATFCATCHQDYLSQTGGIWDTTKHRHPVGISLNTAPADIVRYDANKFNLPTATIDSPGRGTLVCVTCHFAHGTFVRVSNIKTADSLFIDSAGTDLDLQNLPDYPSQEPPKNLRMDNRGVCQNCHNWSSVDTSGPRLTYVLDPTKTGKDLYNDPATLINGVYALSSSPTTVVIRFDQYVLQRTHVNSAEKINNYTLKQLGVDLNIAGSGATATVQPDGKTVVIRLLSPLDKTKAHTLTVSNVMDTNFQMLNSTPPSPSTTDIPVTFTW